ncbi:MAG: DUF6428 family protein [Pseudomonadota bacterium]
MLMTLEQLLGALQPSGEAALVFSADGVPIQAGYHVTEIKHAEIQSLDCGRGAHQWSELIVQLLDGAGGDRTHMPASKFVEIAQAGLAHVPGAQSADLKFEFASANGALHRYEIADVRRESDGTVVVALQAERAQCKAASRALARFTPTSARGQSGSTHQRSTCC